MLFKVTMNLICCSKCVGSFGPAIEQKQIGLGLYRFPTPVTLFTNSSLYVGEVQTNLISSEKMLYLFIYFKENGISVLSKTVSQTNEAEAAAVHPWLGKYYLHPSFFSNVILLSHELRFPFGSKH